MAVDVGPRPSAAVNSDNTLQMRAISIAHRTALPALPLPLHRRSLWLTRPALQSVAPVRPGLHAAVANGTLQLDLGYVSGKPPPCAAYRK